MRLVTSQSPGGDWGRVLGWQATTPSRAQAGCSHPGAQHFYGWNGKKVLAEGPSGCMWAILKPWHSPQLPKHSGNLGSYKLRPSRVWFTPGRGFGVGNWWQSSTPSPAFTLSMNIFSRISCLGDILSGPHIAFKKQLCKTGAYQLFRVVCRRKNIEVKLF